MELSGPELAMGILLCEVYYDQPLFSWGTPFYLVWEKELEKNKITLATKKIYVMNSIYIIISVYVHIMIYMYEFNVRSSELYVNFT